MELNEALRRLVSGRWWLLVTCLAVPVVVVVALGLARAPLQVASARIQASSRPSGSETEADAVLDRVKGIATDEAVVAAALREAAVREPAAAGRSPAELARDHVDATRLGSSAVIDLTVTDRDPRVATALAGALAGQVVGFLNRTAADAATSSATTTGSGTTGSGSGTTGSGSGTTGAGSGSGGAGAGGGDPVPADPAALISRPARAQRAPSRMGVDAVLACVLGLACGLLLAAGREALWPRVAGARAFGREVGAPLVGRLPAAGATRRRAVAGDDAEVLVPTGTALRRAAARAEVDVLVLIGTGGDERLRAMAAALGPAADPPGAPPGTPPGPVVTVLRDAGDPRPGRTGIVAVVPAMTPYSQVLRVRDLAAATGWPVIGVLEDPDRPRSARRRGARRDAGTREEP